MEIPLKPSGIPLSLQVSNKADITVYDKIILKEVHIIEPNYRVQILILDKRTQSIGQSLEQLKNEISSHVRFDRFNREGKNGFIFTYKNKLLENAKIYGMRYIIENESYKAIFKEFEQDRPTLSELKKIYDIALSAKWME